MAGSARIVTRATVAGVTIESIFNRSDELEQAFQAELPPAIEGVLTTRTGDTAGVITVSEGHGITDADTIAIFWEDGSSFAASVDATTATTITIDALSGDSLPTQDTAVVVGKEQVHSLPFDGDDLSVLAVGCRLRSSVSFEDGSMLEFRYDLQSNEGRLWFAGSDATNPLASESIDSVRIANGGLIAQVVSIGLLIDTE